MSTVLLVPMPRCIAAKFLFPFSRKHSSVEVPSPCYIAGGFFPESATLIWLDKFSHSGLNYFTLTQRRDIPKRPTISATFFFFPFFCLHGLFPNLAELGTRCLIILNISTRALFMAA